MSLIDLLIRAKSALVSKKQLEAADRFLLRPFADFPIERPDFTIVCGATAATGALALKAVELAQKDLLGDQIVFTGKPAVTSGPAATEILTALHKDGQRMPETDAISEGAHGAAVFREEYQKRTGELPDKLVKVLYEENSTNTQENFREAVKLLSLPKGRPLIAGLIALPNALRRTMMTAKLELGSVAAFVPHMAWIPQAGIGPDTWQQSPLARVQSLIELNKIIPTAKNPIGLYPAKGFCLPVDPPFEAKVLAVALERRRQKQMPTAKTTLG